MAISELNYDVNYKGSHNFSGATVLLPAGSLTESSIAATTKFPAANVIHVIHKDHRQSGGTNVADADEMVFVAKYAGSLKYVKVAAETAPTGDYTVTVDVQRAATGGAFATVLNAAESISSSNSNNTPVDATLSGTVTTAVNDIYKVTVTVAGTSGTQAQGLCVDLIFHEDAQ